MSTGTISLETLMKNVDELYSLAGLLECKVDVPISELRQSFERSFEKSAPKVAAKLSSLGSRGKIEEALILGGALCVAWVGAGAIDLTRNAIARKKAENALLPLYKEIAVKTQQIILQMSDDNKKLTALLLEERQRNVNNQLQIEILRKRIEKGEAIVRRFMELQSKG